MTWRAAAETLVSDLRHVFAGRLRSVLAYGPHIEGVDEAPLTCLALVESLSVSDLEACARVEPEWERRRLATPLLVPEDEFRRSLDAFPLEYGEIIRTHQRVFGDDPFDGVQIPKEDLRRACETQVKSHLVHLREDFLEGGGRPSNVAALVRESAPAFTALLRHLARLDGVSVETTAELIAYASGRLGLNGRIVSDVVALSSQEGMASVDPGRIFPDYLAAVERLAEFVDSWRAR